jgi:drug/metabolite transporter (DMT)-like permease
MISPSRVTGILFAFSCLAILGVMPLLASSRPVGSDGLAFAIWLTGWQLVAALPLFIMEMRGGNQHQIRRAPGSNALFVALLTGAMFGISTYMYVVAAEKAGAINMVLALQSYPLIAMATEAVFLGKRKSVAEAGFTLLSVLALAYLVTDGSFRPDRLSHWTLFALGIPVLWTVAHLLLKRVLENLSVTPNQVTVSRLIISGLFLLLVQAGLGQTGTLVQALASREFMLAAAALGIAYYLELLLWFYAMRHIDVSLASSITVPAPAITMLISAFYLGQTVQLHQIVAMVLVTAGIYGLLAAGRQRESRLGGGAEPV